MQVVTIDDKNPRINYTTGWYNADGKATNFNQTVTVSGGPNCGFLFKFNGTSISVYGSIPPNDTAVSTYSLDTSSSVTFKYPNNTGSQYTSNQLLYQSPELEDGLHTLAVNTPDTVIGDASTQFYFDYLTYTPSVSDTASTSTTGNSGGSSNRAKVIVPAVLLPCLVIIGLLSLALWMQNRRMKTALLPTPLKQESASMSFMRENKTRSTLKLPSLPESHPTPSHPEVHDIRAPFSPSHETVSDFAFPSSPIPSTLAEPPSMATAVPPPSMYRARMPPSAFRPDPMLEMTRARRLERFDGQSTLGSTRTRRTDDVPPTYRSTG